MLELHLPILFDLDGQKEDLLALSHLTFLNSFHPLTIGSLFVYLRKWGFVPKSRTSLQITLSKEVSNIFGMIFPLHLSKLMLGLVKDRPYPPFYPLFISLRSYIL